MGSVSSGSACGTLWTWRDVKEFTGKEGVAEQRLSTTWGQGLGGRTQKGAGTRVISRAGKTAEPRESGPGRGA